MHYRQCTHRLRFGWKTGNPELHPCRSDRGIVLALSPCVVAWSRSGQVTRRKSAAPRARAYSPLSPQSTIRYHARYSTPGWASRHTRPPISSPRAPILVVQLRSHDPARGALTDHSSLITDRRSIPTLNDSISAVISSTSAMHESTSAEMQLTSFQSSSIASAEVESISAELELHSVVPQLTCFQTLPRG